MSVVSTMLSPSGNLSVDDQIENNEGQEWLEGKDEKVREREKEREGRWRWRWRRRGEEE